MGNSQQEQCHHSFRSGHEKMGSRLKSVWNWFCHMIVSDYTPTVPFLSEAKWVCTLIGLVCHASFKQFLFSTALHLLIYCTVGEAEMQQNWTADARLSVPRWPQMFLDEWPLPHRWSEVSFVIYAFKGSSWFKSKSFFPLRALLDGRFLSSRTSLSSRFYLYLADSGWGKVQEHA